MKRSEFLVLWAAADQFDVWTLVSGVDVVATGGEPFSEFTPLSHAEAVRAVFEALDHGFIALYRRRSGVSEPISDAEAHHMLREQLALSDESPVWALELSLTEDGEQAFNEAWPLLGAEDRAASAAAKRASEAFLAQHLDHDELMAKWHKELTAWVEDGGDPPEHPYRGRDWLSS